MGAFFVLGNSPRFIKGGRPMNHLSKGSIEALGFQLFRKLVRNTRRYYNERLALKETYSNADYLLIVQEADRLYRETT